MRPDVNQHPARRSTEFPADFWAVAITVLVALASTFVATFFLQSYGYGLFLAMPILLPALTTVLDSTQNRPTFGRALALSLISTGIFLPLLLIGGVEGMICILMAAPLWLIATIVGVALGLAVAQLAYRSGTGGPTALVLLVLIPVLAGADRLLPRAPTIYSVTTAVEVDAPPEMVWEHVIGFPPLPPPREWLFRMGVAYPTHACIDGRGVGAVRTCWFSTGPFVEPVTEWSPPLRLRFDVTANPPPMKELSPHGELDLPHLHGFMVSRRGQFELQPLPGGRTRLVGTTWYSHGLFPESYWRLWSDRVIHAIHRRVLDHIRVLAEGGAPTKSAAQGG